MKFFLTNSVSNKKEEFIPQIENLVTIYMCGPTVYDDAHLGHGRSAIAFDVLRRVLKAIEYKVTFVSNITDVDDKIIKRMSTENRDLKEITTFFTSSYQRDMKALKVLPPDITPKATEHIKEMEDLIITLMQKDIAYKVENGDIYFDTSKDLKYGKISGQTQEETQSRVQNSYKRNNADFVLWKNAKDDDLVYFDSNFGKGRPGWHLECSSMLHKYLNVSQMFDCDIHAGGEDLFFPHHENEGAQSRCAYNKEIAKYWMHNGFVRIDGQKMSKSLGNSFFLKDALNKYLGEVLRFYLMSVHYKNEINFNEDDLIAAKKRLDRLYRLKKRVYGISKKQADPKFIKAVLAGMCDDLNISIALREIDLMISNTNELLDKNPKDKNLKSTIISNIEFLDELLGFGGEDPFIYFQFGISNEQKDLIESLIKQRDDAKREKNYQLADELRSQLCLQNISIMDTPNGTLWEILSEN